MKQYRSEQHLQELANRHAEAYQSNQPFPHIYFDNFFEPSDLTPVLDAFPSPDAMDFYKYDNALEKKIGNGSTVKTSRANIQFTAVLEHTHQS